MKIKFHETLYNLVSTPNVSALRFQATIEKGDNTYDAIIADTVDVEEITVYNDEDEVVGIYNGYTNRVAISIIDNISIELSNTDIEAQINALTQQTASLDAGVSELAEDVAVLNETQESQDAAIEELAESIL